MQTQTYAKQLNQVRVLYITPELTTVGGVQTYCRELAAGVAAAGCDVSVLQIAAADLLKRLTLFDRLPSLAYWERFYFWRAMYTQDYRFHKVLCRDVHRRIQLWQPDTVHVMHVYLGTALRNAGVPSVITCHGMEIDNSPPVRIACQAAGVIHSVSNFTAARVQSLFPALSSKIEVHRWGIKPRNDSWQQEKEFDLVTVGRLVPRKNVDTILRALSELPSVRYAIIGDGPEIERLKGLAESLKLQNVTFFGQVDESVKWAVVARSRVFVTCPRQDDDSDVEGLGLVFFEAHGCGVPVIGARSGGAPEAIGDGGVLVDNALDVHAVRAAIRRSLDPNESLLLKSKVANRIVAYSWEKYIDGIIGMYERVSAKRQKSIVSAKKSPQFAN